MAIQEIPQAHRDGFRTAGRHADDDTELCKAVTRPLHENGMQDCRHDFHQSSAYRTDLVCTDLIQPTSFTSSIIHCVWHSMSM